MKLPRVGVRLPRLGASPLVSQWLLAVLGCSVVSWFDGGWMESRFALIPSRVWLGDVWRLGTWVFIEPAPVLLVLTCAAIFKLGTDLSGSWRDARLQQYVLHGVLGAGALTTIVASLTDMSRLDRVGGWALINLLVIGWARQFRARRVELYGVVVTSSRLIGVVCLVSVVVAGMTGPVVLAPELAACAIALLYPISRLVPPRT